MFGGPAVQGGWDLDRTEWTDADFEELSWHDNHVHGITINSAATVFGELILDLDFIVEWVCAPGGSCDFRIAPATLTFREVTDLKIAIDYASVSASVCPFSIAGIKRTPRDSGRSFDWAIEVNWPRGEISFQASGFRQTLRGPVRVSSEQRLAAADRL